MKKTRVVNRDGHEVYADKRKWNDAVAETGRMHPKGGSRNVHDQYEAAGGGYESDDSGGIWNPASLKGPRDYRYAYPDGRSFPVSQTAQRIAGLKTYMRDELGLEGVVTGIQKPFETLAARANQNPNGRLYRAAPMVFDPIGLVAEGMLRLVGRAGLIEQMYPDQAESKTRSVPSPETG